MKSVENANRKKFPVAARALHDRPARPRRLGQGAEALLRPVERASWPAFQRQVGGSHWLRSPSAVARRSRAIEGQGRHGPVLGFVTTFLIGHGRGLPIAALMWEATSEGAQSLLGRGLEPGGDRGAEADARRIARRRRSSTPCSARSPPGCSSATTSAARRSSTRSSTSRSRLPTIVAGLTLLALYGPTVAGRHRRRLHARRRSSLALMFVTLPFVVRTVQPVLQELDPEMEEAAQSLGASTGDDVPARSSSRTSCPGSSPASRSRSRRPSASSARS